MQSKALNYGILMGSFMALLPDEVKHKSWFVKIDNRLNRYQKRHRMFVGQAVRKVNNVIIDGEAHFKKNNLTISIGALCWLIHNKHKEDMKPYGFDKIWFEQMNKHFNAQGAILDTMKVLNKLEELLDGN